MKKIICVYGSAVSDKVKINNAVHQVWINASHFRSYGEDKTYKTVAISEGLLLTKKQLIGKKAIDHLGLNIEDSFKHRLLKREIVSNLSSETIYCISNLSKKTALFRLKEMNNRYQRLIMISDLKIHSYLKKFFGPNLYKLKPFRDLTKIQKIKINFSQLFGLRLRYASKIRPSTGVAMLLCMIFEHKEDDVKFYISGITGKFPNYSIHPIDKYIIDKLKTYPNFKFEEPHKSSMSLSKAILYKIDHFKFNLIQN